MSKLYISEKLIIMLTRFYISHDPFWLNYHVVRLFKLQYIYPSTFLIFFLEWEIFIGPNGEAIILANVEDKYFAINAKCPHLGLPMKRGKFIYNVNIYCHRGTDM